MAKKCFLCDSDDQLLDFNDEIFNNCLLKLAFRKRKNFKYGDVNLTKASRNYVGYHTTCLKKVNVLKNQYNEEFEKFCEETSELLKTPIAEEGSACLDSSVHSNKTLTDGEQSDVDDTSKISASFDEGPSTSGVPTSTQHTCLFCNCVQKRCGKQKQNLIFSVKSSQQIKKMAEGVDDLEILSKLERQPIYI